jgi:hypothetical protein
MTYRGQESYYGAHSYGYHEGLRGAAKRLNRATATGANKAVVAESEIELSYYGDHGKTQQQDARSGHPLSASCNQFPSRLAAPVFCIAVPRGIVPAINTKSAN